LRNSAGPPGGGTIANAGTINGPLNVGAGVVFDNSGQIIINSGPDGLTLGGTLKGSGRLQGPVNVQSGGMIAPGSGPGRMLSLGRITMVAGSTFEAELNGPLPETGYDRLDLTGGGSISLGGSSLRTLLGYAPSPADSLAIIAGRPVTGTFAGLPNGARFVVGSFAGSSYFADITYTANAVVLSNLRPVPEPAGWLLAGGAAAAWAWQRRRSAILPTASSPARRARRA
jgi:hypothetical protein